MSITDGNEDPKQYLESMEIEPRRDKRENLRIYNDIKGLKKKIDPNVSAQVFELKKKMNNIRNLCSFLWIMMLLCIINPLTIKSSFWKYTDVFCLFATNYWEIFSPLLLDLVPIDVYDKHDKDELTEELWSDHEILKNFGNDHGFHKENAFATFSLDEKSFTFLFFSDESYSGHTCFFKVVINQEVRYYMYLPSSIAKKKFSYGKTNKLGSLIELAPDRVEAAVIQTPTITSCATHEEDINHDNGNFTRGQIYFDDSLENQWEQLWENLLDNSTKDPCNQSGQPFEFPFGLD